MVSKEEEIVTLFEGIQEQLNQDWIRFRDQHHNPSNKGASYEEALGDFLHKYYKGVYEIQTETVVIDKNLDVFESFDTSRGEHEIDLVGLFESARPRIVFDIGEMTYVPLTGVAFLCEVKSKIDSGRLEKDLSKLRKVSDLAKKEDRSFPFSQTGNYTTENQIKCLVYDENSISEETLVDKLIENRESWDLLLLVQDNVLFVNSTLPIFNDISGPADIFSDELDIEEITFDVPDSSETDEISPDEIFEAEAELRHAVRRSRNFGTLNHGLSWFLLLLSASIPRPLGVETTDTLRNLLEEYDEITSSDDLQI